MIGQQDVDEEFRKVNLNQNFKRRLFTKSNQLQKNLNNSTHLLKDSLRDVHIIYENQYYLIKRVENVKKCMYFTQIVPTDINNFDISSMNHENILQIGQEDNIFIAEPMLMTLQNYIYQQQDISNDLEQIIKQIANFIQFLHSQNLAHTELSTKNFLINEKLQLRAVPLPQEGVQYRAPERIIGYDVENMKSEDMFQLGCIILELLARKPILESHDETNQMIKYSIFLGRPVDIIYRSIYHQLPDTQPVDIDKYLSHCDQRLVNLIPQLLVYDPEKRATIQQVQNYLNQVYPSYRPSSKSSTNNSPLSLKSQRMTPYSLRNRNKGYGNLNNGSPNYYYQDEAPSINLYDDSPDELSPESNYSKKKIDEQMRTIVEENSLNNGGISQLREKILSGKQNQPSIDNNQGAQQYSKSQYPRNHSSASNSSNNQRLNSAQKPQTPKRYNQNSMLFNNDDYLKPQIIQDRLTPLSNKRHSSQKTNNSNITGRGFFIDVPNKEKNIQDHLTSFQHLQKIFGEENKQKSDDERKKKLEEEMKKQAEEDWRKKEEEDKKKRDEEERIKKDEEEKKKRDEQEQKRKEVEEKRKKDEEEKKKRDEEEKKKKDEEEKKLRDEEERRKKDLEDKKKKEEDEKRQREEEENRKKDDLQKKKDEEQKQLLEEHRKKQQEEENKRKLEEDLRKKLEEEQKRIEEQLRKQFELQQKQKEDELRKKEEEQRKKDEELKKKEEEKLKLEQELKKKEEALRLKEEEDRKLKEELANKENQQKQEEQQKILNVQKEAEEKLRKQLEEEQQKLKNLQEELLKKQKEDEENAKKKQLQEQKEKEQEIQQLKLKQEQLNEQERKQKELAAELEKKGKLALEALKNEQLKMQEEARKKEEQMLLELKKKEEELQKQKEQAEMERKKKEEELEQQKKRELEEIQKKQELLKQKEQELEKQRKIEEEKQREFEEQKKREQENQKQKEIELNQLKQKELEKLKEIEERKEREELEKQKKQKEVEKRLQEIENQKKKELQELMKQKELERQKLRELEEKDKELARKKEKDQKKNLENEREKKNQKQQQPKQSDSDVRTQKEDSQIESSKPLKQPKLVNKQISTEQSQEDRKPAQNNNNNNNNTNQGNIIILPESTQRQQMISNILQQEIEFNEIYRQRQGYTHYRFKNNQVNNPNTIVNNRYQQNPNSSKATPQIYDSKQSFYLQNNQDNLDANPSLTFRTPRINTDHSTIKSALINSNDRNNQNYKMDSPVSNIPRSKHKIQLNGNTIVVEETPENSIHSFGNLPSYQPVYKEKQPRIINKNKQIIPPLRSIAISLPPASDRRKQSPSQPGTDRKYQDSKKNTLNKSVDVKKKKKKSKGGNSEIKRKNNYDDYKMPPLSARNSSFQQLQDERTKFRQSHDGQVITQSNTDSIHSILNPTRMSQQNMYLTTKPDQPTVFNTRLLARPPTFLIQKDTDED